MSGQNQITVFSHEQFGDLRIVDRNGEPWFVARDIAEALEYVNAAKAVRMHCKGSSEMGIPSAGGYQVTKIIPEADLYRLVMRSKMKKAEEFADWVVEDVLPSIRKTGSYSLSQRGQTVLDAEWKAAVQAETMEMVAATVREVTREFVQVQRQFRLEYSSVVDDN
jgi:prophage antirepressor-like protein